MTEDEIRVVRELIRKIEEMDNVGDYGIPSGHECVNAARTLIGEPPQ